MIKKGAKRFNISRPKTALKGTVGAAHAVTAKRRFSIHAPTGAEIHTIQVKGKGEREMSEMLRNQRETGSSLSGLPFERDVIFSDHQNNYKKRIEKRQTKLLSKLSFLKPFLKEGEKILLVTTGCSPMSLLEQFLTGWIVFYLKQSMFVFTNKRIFHIPTKSGNKYRNSVAHIPYEHCRSIEIKGRSLVVTYQNDKKEKFYYMAWSEKKKIRALLQTAPTASAPGRKAARMHLCPRCTAELIENKYTCPNCHLEFKNAAVGKKVSILYPGGGYFYTGHWFLGIGDALTELFLLLFVVGLLVSVWQGAHAAVVTLIIFLILLILEKAVSVYHTNHFIKEYIPAKKDIAFPVASQQQAFMK
ncbi:MAG TPA: hypothetical protein PK090_02515 [Smithellaceae bacterium]|nr:hypothetical protein [Smithellaceae bacterium]